MKQTMRLLVAAAVQARNGNHQRAAMLLQEASKADDIRKCIAAVGALPAAKAPAKKETASSTKRVTASSWPFKVTAGLSDLDEPEDWEADLKFDAKDSGKLRETQTGGFDDDLDLMGLDEDMGGEEDFVMSAADDEEDDKEEEAAFGEDDEDEKEEAAADDEDEDDGDKEEEKKDKAEARRIHAALANLAVLSAKAKAKKKVAKKKK